MSFFKTEMCCRKCGARLDPDGTCLACLLAGGFATEQDALPGVESDSSMAEVEPQARAAALDLLEQDRFGPYRMLGLLGQGGMGAVYLAEQTTPLRRKLALKVVKLGLDSSQVLSRFNYERQALAQMDHPNIARVFDAGTSEKGRPYFVMEYVDGLPITQYCDQHRLNTKERLDLFIPVCLALQHAHQKGVIHRDIKPSNVLVTEVDGAAVAKVIDFGIARATEQCLTEFSAFTELGEFVGTPEYMSPEQADLLTGDIETSSDVYSLGVLLYELLIGAVPFEPKTLRQAGLAELLRIIREEEPVPMPVKLTRMGDTAGEIAGRRRTDSATLWRLVSGDLNWIVLKALEKDRRRRYPAASDLATEIRRYLHDEPVVASPPSASYRARKFFRRHKLPVAAAAVVLAALIAGIFATSWEAAIARRERTEALAARALAEQRSREVLSQRNRAEKETAIALRQQELAEHQRSLAESRLDDVHVLADSMLFEINDDVKDLAGGTKAREALVRLGQQYLNKEASEDDPRRREEVAEAFLKVGDLQGAPGQSNLRDVTGARQSYGHSVAILEREAASSPHNSYLRHLLTVAYVRQAQLAESASAERAGLERAAKSAAVYISDWPDDPQGLRDRAEVLQAQGRRAEAVALRERILAGNPNDARLRRELAQAELALGSSLVQNDNPKALEWLQKSAAACAALSKEDPSNVQYQRDLAVALAGQSRVLLPLNRVDEALTQARQSVSILQQLTGSDRRNASFRLDLSDAAIALFTALEKKGRTPEALENLALAAAIQQEQAQRFPDNSDFPRQTALYYRMAGDYKTSSMDFQGALGQYRAAETIDRKLSAQYPTRVEFKQVWRLDEDSIGDSLLALQQKQAAFRAYRDALEIAKSAEATKPSEESERGLAEAHRGLAAVWKAYGRWNDAILEQREVVAVYDRQNAAKADNLEIQSALGFACKELSMLYESRGDFPSAVAASEKALRLVNANYAAHPDNKSFRSERWNVLFHLLSQYPAVGEYDRAIAAGSQMVEIAEASPNLGPFWRDLFLAQSLRDMGGAMLRCGRREESLATLHRALDILDQHPIEKETSLVYQKELARNYLYIVEQMAGAHREEESEAVLKRLVPVLEGMFRDHPEDNVCRNTLLRSYRAGASVSLALGDLRSSLDFQQKELAREPLPVSPADIYDHALRLARIGSVKSRLQSSATAEPIWREALADFEQAARASEQQWTSDRQDVKALQSLQLAARGAAFLMEELGNTAGALHLRESAYLRAAAALKTDGAGTDHASQAASQADAVFAFWRIAGDQGDYKPYFENTDPSPEELRAVLLDGWRDRLEQMDLFGVSIPPRIESAKGALEMSRQFVASNPSGASRLALARSLLLQGDVFSAAARSSTEGEEMSSYCRRSRDSYREALDILNSLRQGSRTSGAGNASLIAVTNALADAEERLKDGAARLRSSK